MAKKKVEPEVKNILKEIKIEEKRVGFVDEFGKIAVLNPKELIEREQRPKYEQKVHQLAERGYKVIYTSAEKPKKLSRKRVYDILESL